MATPTILDTLSDSLAHTMNGQTTSFTYTVPGGGSNKLLVCMWVTGTSGTNTTVLSQNGVSFLSTKVRNIGSPGYETKSAFIAYLAAPTTGTFTITDTDSPSGVLFLFTLQDAAQSSPLDTGDGVGHGIPGGGSTTSDSITTTVGNDFLLSRTSCQGTISSLGSNQTQVAQSLDAGTNRTYADWKAAGSAAASETTTTNAGGNVIYDHTVWAIKYQAPASGPANVKTKDGITQSTGIKTYMGVVVASVKSVEGVT